MPRIDLAHYKGRELAYVKHYLLEEYLPEWAYKVGAAWDSLVYVDGFAGPWQTTHPNYADSSFGVAVEVLRKCQSGLHQRGRDLQIECILVDQDKRAFNHLQQFATTNTAPGFGIHALGGQFVEQIPAIEDIIKERTRNPFRFIFLDPKGWADIPMHALKPILRKRSCEVLITLMTRHIIRFLDEPDREESYANLFGRSEVLSELRRESFRTAPPHERAERAVREYGRSLRLLCGFTYVASAVILEPNEESIRYFLVYGTNHPRGIEVFKDAETKAANIQEVLRYETRIQRTHQPTLTFDDMPPSSRLSVQLRTFFANAARNKLMELLLAKRSGFGIRYSDLFCEVMEYPLVKEADLLNWLKGLEPHIKIVLSGTSRRRKPSPIQDDTIVVDRDNLTRQIG